MRSGNAASHRRARGPANAADRIEKRRVIGRGCACDRRLAALPPASHLALELDVALRRLHVLEETVDDLLNCDSFCFGRKVREDAMPEHGTRDANDVGR